MEVETIDMAVS